MYTCGFCGKTFDNTREYAACVAACAENEAKRIHQIEAQEREKKAKERRDKIKSTYDELLALVSEEYKNDPNSSLFEIVFPYSDFGKSLWF